MALERPLKIIQWATGSVGRYAIGAITEDPQLELAGVWVHGEAKEGQDAGTIAGIAPIGLEATRDIDGLLAIDADCVLYAPLLADVGEMCRILESGKNIVTPTGFSFIKDPILASRLESACRVGGVSFHGSGIHPGFAGDRLPLVLSALCRRIDKVTIREVCDLSQGSESPEMMMEQLGFGMSAEDAAKEPPALMGVMSTIFYESMDMLAAGLGFELDGYEHHHEFSVATRDIPVHAGMIQKGQVAGQHFEYIGKLGERHVIEFQTYWKMSRDLDKDWPYDAPLEYTVEVEGDPSVRCTLSAIDSHTTEPGLVWTAMNCVNALAPVCRAEVGIRSSLDLPIICATGRFAT
ncbi:MAG: dihydrodipicolinate reductase [bacterium]|nr:dihydrodipicolinate reductase [Deltaproteobacteria bacterium]MCP4904885.1 dihydrodipicolinate reductase [bacterium]